jgi:hypothetical protein
MTIKLQLLDFAVSIIAVAGRAFGTCKSSADIPICSAMARASSSTLLASFLQAASYRSVSSCDGIHPGEAIPLPWWNGGGSVTVMTVALAFKRGYRIAGVESGSNDRKQWRSAAI